MPNANGSPLSIPRLVLVPTLLTLGITLLRLTGELRAWPSPWFDKDNGLVGITQLLPALVGFYFAWKLWGAGLRIDRIGRAFTLGALGVVLNEVVERAVFPHFDMSIFTMLLMLWAVAVLSAFLQCLAWPGLFKALTLYGFGARIPVVIIMFFALRGHWGTHYDYLSGPSKLDFWPRFFWFAFFEELIYWVSFTVAVGALAGSVAAAIAKRRTPKAYLAT
jgi:hypothetical protein